MHKRAVCFSFIANLCLLVSLALPACGTDKPEPPPEDVAPAAKSGPPKIVADEATFKFGEVEQGTSVKHVFVIRNEGGTDLKIERAKGS